jgi:hypothetical protein
MTKLLGLSIAVAAVVCSIGAPASAEQLSQADITMMDQIGPALSDIAALQVIAQTCQGHMKIDADDDTAKKVEVWASNALSANLGEVNQQLNDRYKVLIVREKIFRVAGLLYNQMVDRLTMDKLCAASELTDMRSEILSQYGSRLVGVAVMPFSSSPAHSE